MCVCVCVDCVLATWLSCAATFGAELGIYLLTQNTDTVSNLFLLRESLPLLVTAFIITRKQEPMQTWTALGGLKIRFIKCDYSTRQLHMLCNVNIAQER